MEGTDQILVCTHATLRFAFEELEDHVFNNTLVKIHDNFAESASQWCSPYWFTRHRKIFNCPCPLTEYKDQGLRLIEIERDDLSDLPEIQKLIQKRPEKFIVYCDDLAFNAEDENYRSLKVYLMAHYSQVQVILLFMQPATVDICYQNLCMRTRQWLV